MKRRWRAFLAYAVLALLVLARVAPLGFPQQSPSQPKYPGGHLRYTYRMETGVAGLAETTTTEITPRGDGQHDVVTTTRTVAGGDQIRLGFAGFSLRWLGVYVSEDMADRIDLSALNALAQQVLEPGRRYLLPDGGLLETGDRVTVAGLSGVEGVYTRSSAPNVRVTVVLADDLTVRQLLPFPLRVQLEYSQSAGAGLGEEASTGGAYISGKIELLEYAWSGAEGAVK
jgi:hypothetical protein